MVNLGEVANHQRSTIKESLQDPIGVTEMLINITMECQ